MFNLRTRVIHPILISIYPILFQFAGTGFETEIEQIIRPLVFTILLSILILLVLHKFVQDWNRAGLFSTIAVIYAFYFGIAFNGLHDNIFNQYKIFQPSIFFFFWTIIFGGLTFIIGKSKLHNTNIFTLWLNITSVLVLAQPLLLTSYIIIFNNQNPINVQNVEKIGLPPMNDVVNLPDIYYIILDGYGREDTLREIFNYSNHEFILAIQEKGFYIAGQSRTNFLQSALSIASSLNMNYLTNLQKSGENSKNRLVLKNLISDSQIREILNSYGYKFVSFNTGYNLTKIENADIYYDHFLRFNNIEEVLLSNSVLLILDGFSNIKIPFYTYHTHRSRIQFTLNQIKNIPKIEEPTFTIAHLMIPHPPFVFNKYGNSTSPDWSYNIHDANLFLGTRSNYRDGYINQLEYINSELLTLIDILIAESENPPIIIVQGDHGSRMLLNWESEKESCYREAGSILNAYYLPDFDSTHLYPSISPVNSFRIILNEYFSRNIPILEDKTYFSNFTQPYNFEDITDKLTETCNLSSFSQ